MKRTLASSILVTSLALAACGGDDSDTSVTDAPPVTSPAPTEPPATDPPATDPPATEAPATDPPAPADGTAITIADFSFQGVTEVSVGDTVVVTNTDSTPHTWTAEDGTFDSGAIGSGESFEFTFTEPGQFSYFCNFHPSMTGQIVVTG